MSKIQWTERTWNPTRGCRRISPGCVNCYAEKVATRFCGEGLPYEGLIQLGKWNGETTFAADKLTDPLSWQKPALIFVDSMSDLFYEGFSAAQIDQVLAVMLLTPRHTYQVLTKRADRMAKYLTDPGLYGRVLACADEIRLRHPRLRLNEIGISDPSKVPASWIWWGVSVENQEYADKRIPWLLDTPAAVRFVSYEPALGPVDFTRMQVVAPRPPNGPGVWLNALTGHVAGPDDVLPAKLDWLIAGGESGTGARPFDIAWAHSAVEQCKAAGVPVFVKQLGARPIGLRDDVCDACSSGLVVPRNRHGLDCPGGPVLRDPKGGDWTEWPADLRVREFPR